MKESDVHSIVQFTDTVVLFVILTAMGMTDVSNSIHLAIVLPFSVMKIGGMRAMQRMGFADSIGMPIRLYWLFALCHCWTMVSCFLPGTRSLMPWVGMLYASSVAFAAGTFPDAMGLK